MRRVDGGRSLYLDPYADTLNWMLKLENLSADEWQAIESLFRACQGRLKTFAFIDPLGNMLSHSESLRAQAWDSDAYLSVSDGESDMWDTLKGSQLVNAGQDIASISQTLPVSAALQYTLSVYLRSASPVAVELFIDSEGAERRARVPVSSQWKRFTMTAGLAVETESCRFGISIPAGYTVNCCGFQAEAQPYPSRYKPSVKGAVYRDARFDTDTLPVEVGSPGCFSTTLRLTSPA